MSAIVMDGKAVAQNIKDKIKDEIDSFPASLGKPCLAVVIVGNNPASKVYVKNKKKACNDCLITSVEHSLPANISEQALLTLIHKLNEDQSIHGILCQLPLPAHINQETVLNSIIPIKDVDAFHPINVGKLTIGDYDMLPCTPAGVMELLDAYKIDFQGKHCVIIGRSNIVGKPLSMLMLQRNATVTITHSYTKNLVEHLRNADILISAVGKERLITQNMVKNGCVIIDVAMNRDKQGHLCGDVCFDDVKNVASHITPVPGGVGPMTIAILMKNTLRAFKIQRSVKI